MNQDSYLTEIQSDFQLHGEAIKLRNCQLAIAERRNGDESFFIKITDCRDNTKAMRERLRLEAKAVNIMDSPFFLDGTKEIEYKNAQILTWPYERGVSLAHLIRFVYTQSRSLSSGLVTQLFAILLDQTVQLHNNCNTSSQLYFILLGADLKNLWVTESGDLVSIGLADVVTPDLVGDPKYWAQSLAPEFLMAGATINERSEVYAAGVTLFQLLTQRAFISAQELDQDLMYRLFRGVHPRPSDLGAHLAGYDAIVEKATQWLPERRHASIDELQTEIAMLAEKDLGSGNAVDSKAELKSLVAMMIGGENEFGSSLSTQDVSENMTLTTL